MYFVGRAIQDYYCNGFFGRRYDLAGAIIEAQGNDYMVIRTRDGVPVFAYFDGHWESKMEELIAEWVGDVTNGL